LKTLAFYSSVLGFFTFSPILLALDSNQVASFTQRIGNPDPAIRLAAMNELGKLAERTPGKAGNEVIPIFAKGLTDSDAKVRENAAADLAVIAMQTAPRFLPPKPGSPDLLSFPSLKASLEAAMFDPDPEVRRAVWGSYALTFDLAPDMQAKLIQQFPNEQNTGFQPAIISLLTSCKSPTPATEAFLTQLLNDQKNLPFVIQSFANTPSSWNLPPPPAAALPKLADMLVQEKDTEKRQALARAVGKYGAQARPYLAHIEQLRDKEADPTTKANLKAAADAIRAGKPLQDE
jgi:hypothetical protein